MKEDLADKLIKDFPYLYESGDSSFHFECGDGWYELIRQLSEKLYPFILKAREEQADIYPKASQVKEKFGGLRFYMSVSTEEMDDIIDAYEEISEDICEVCGKPGSINYFDRWLSARCPDHR